MNNFIINGKVHIKYRKYHIFCNKIIYDKNNNKFYGYGKVRVKFNNIKLVSNYFEYCNNNNVPQLKFLGNILLKKNKIKLTAKKINFFVKSKRLQATKNVVFILDKLKLITNKFEYNFLSKKLTYNNQGTIFYKNYIIHSDKGYLFPEKGKIELKNRIKFFDKNQKKYIIQTNILNFFPKKEIISCKPYSLVEKNNNNFFHSKNAFLNIKNKIFLFNDINLRYKNIYLKCKYLFFNKRKNNGFFKKIILNNSKKDYFLYGNNGMFNFNYKNINIFINKKPKIIIKKIKNYIIIINSKYLKTVLNNNNFSIKSTNNKIRIPSKNIVGTCSLLKYQSKENHAQLFNNIIIKKDNDKQIIGDNININLYNKGIKNLIIKNIFFIKKIGNQEFDQIKSNFMIGTFNKNILKKILLDGNVNGIIFIPSFGKEQEKIFNRFSAKKIFLDIENDKIKKIDSFEKINYDFLSFDKNLPKDSIFLPKFNWIDKIK
ncbi:OstA-like protein [Blattabacterium cuenoti]|uniref:OstA-like protein n=1 Tax=Blattabacterium cuenoti TaxID=1653831 RepID=UPI001EEACB66|nr:OstA-like protein [Blattabacterium cuenoti]